MQRILQGVYVTTHVYHWVSDFVSYSQEHREFLWGRRMRHWKRVFELYGQKLVILKIKRWIFQADRLSTLMIVLCLTLSTLIPWNVKVGYDFIGCQQMINHVLCVVDLKLSKSQISSMVDTDRCFCSDIRRDISRKKNGVLILKNTEETRVLEAIELPSGHTMKWIEENGYKYLGIIDSGNKISLQPWVCSKTLDFTTIKA